MLYLLSTTCTYACFTFQYFGKIPDGYQIARVWRNWACDQPVSCSYEIGVFTRRSKLSFRCLLSKVIPFILSTLYIEHSSFDITFIYSYMWDLTYWAHIWCASGFVLKTGCYNLPFFSFVHSTSDLHCLRTVLFYSWQPPSTKKHTSKQAK